MRDEEDLVIIDFEDDEITIEQYAELKHIIQQQYPKARFFYLKQEEGE